MQVAAQHSGHAMGVQQRDHILRIPWRAAGLRPVGVTQGMMANDQSGVFAWKFECRRQSRPPLRGNGASRPIQMPLRATDAIKPDQPQAGQLQHIHIARRPSGKPTLAWVQEALEQVEAGDIVIARHHQQRCPQRLQESNCSCEFTVHGPPREVTTDHHRIG